MHGNIETFGTEKEKNLHRSCLNCGECCNMTSSITKKEKEELLGLINGNLILQNAVFENVANNIKMILKNEGVNMYCLFLDKTKNCLISENRPQVCREYHCDPNKNIQKEYDKRFGSSLVALHNDIILNNKCFEKYKDIINVYNATYGQFCANILSNGR